MVVITKIYYCFGKAITLGFVMLGLGLGLLQNSTLEWPNKPITIAYAHPEPGLTATLKSVATPTDLPLNNAFINAIPSTDGSEVFVTVSGVSLANTQLTLNIDPMEGPAGHRCGHAMTISGTTFIATAGEFAPGKDIGDDGDNTLSITGTVGSQAVSSGDINFQRAFVQPASPETIVLDEGDFELKILNTQSVLADTYLVAMSTNAPPAAAPMGYQFIGRTYTMRPSGSLTASEKPMTLNLRYPVQLPAGVEPQMLTVLRWDVAAQTWHDLGGSLLVSQNLVSLPTDMFGIYGLAAAPVWRDSFDSFGLDGLSASENVQWGPGQTLILTTGAITGSAVSSPITPLNASHWGNLGFSATTSISNALTVDLLDINDNLILSDVTDGADLVAMGIDLETHSGLKLRANFSRNSPLDASPQLHGWQVSWQQDNRYFYLPVVVRGLN